MTIDDPVYKAEKRYAGYPLTPVLRLVPGLEKLRRQGAVAIFEAADGYKAVMLLENALAPGGVIAARDLDPPPGEDWQSFKQGKESMTPAPYYLVWSGRPHDDWTFVWPYQLVRIAVEPFASAFGAAAPPRRRKTPPRRRAKDSTCSAPIACAATRSIWSAASSHPSSTCR